MFDFLEKRRVTGFIKDVESRWLEYKDFILKKDELGFVTDKKYLVIGDGKTPFCNLKKHIIKEEKNMKIEYEEKFIVINKKYLENKPLSFQNEFIEMVQEIRQPDYNYLVVNTDEKYANLIWEIIKMGETIKEINK